ncbi:hypothetical protein Tco_0977406 [Tanacetum coccineum]|uniref:Uncharacterized protein n=1 Tax=Tanacetum coccineum TaxID=301880 RepID=A0ABQ5EK31_9ASTR
MGSHVFASLRLLTSVLHDSEQGGYFGERWEDIRWRFSHEYVDGYDGLPITAGRPHHHRITYQGPRSHRYHQTTGRGYVVELDPEEYEDDETEDGPEDRGGEVAGALSSGRSPACCLYYVELVSHLREHSLLYHHPPLTLLPLELGLLSGFRLPYPFHQRQRGALIACTTIDIHHHHLVPSPLLLSTRCSTQIQTLGCLPQALLMQSEEGEGSTARTTGCRGIDYGLWYWGLLGGSAEASSLRYHRGTLGRVKYSGSQSLLCSMRHDTQDLYAL